MFSAGCQSSNDIYSTGCLNSRGWYQMNWSVSLKEYRELMRYCFFFYNNSQFYSSHRLHLTLRVKWKWSKEFTPRRDGSDLTVAIKDYILMFNSINLTQSHQMLFAFESYCFYWALGSRLISPTCGEPLRTFLFLFHLHGGLYQLKYYSILSEGEVRSGGCYFWRQTQCFYWDTFAQSGVSSTQWESYKREATRWSSLHKWLLCWWVSSEWHSRNTH